MVKYLFILLLGCTSIQNLFWEKDPAKNIPKYEYMDEKDYADYYRHLGKLFFETHKNKQFKLSSQSKSYIEALFEKLMASNELLFGSVRKFQLIIIKSSIPYHFSFPDKKIFISTKLINKYMRNEGDLISVIAYELMRSANKIYLKKVRTPIRFMDIHRLMPLMQLSYDTKLNIDKWVVYALTRAGHDPYFYLSWIQQKNKHSLDFSVYGENTTNYTRREYELKNFYISQGHARRDHELEKNSSKEYYGFIKEFLRGDL